MNCCTEGTLKLDKASLLHAETLFHNANGYIGVRGNFEEGYPRGYDSIRGTYVNGFYDIIDMPQAEKLYGLIEQKQTMVNIADTQGIRLFIDGEMFSLFEGDVLAYERKLDMDEGVTYRTVQWRSPKGNELEIVMKRMASYCILPLFFMQYEVTPLNFSGKVQIESDHIGEVTNYADPNDPRVADSSESYLTITEMDVEAEKSYITSQTSRSDLCVCSAVSHRIDGIHEIKYEKSEEGIHYEISMDVKQGEKSTIWKYAVFCDSIRYEQVRAAADREMEKALQKTPEELYLAQETYMKGFWENCKIEIAGDDELNKAVHYNLYQLLQSVGKDRFCNIAAKGLSGEGYEGHYFWDTEMYLQPFFVLTNRTIAKNLIYYRYTILEHAKENAKILGHKKGAAYPWRTIMGEECSGFFPSGSAQYHINGDIAYSIISYYLAAKDISLLQACGAEILIETARLWLELGTRYKDRFEIHTVTGPDEYSCLVNNNYYTNVVAKYNLEWAVKAYRILQQKNMANKVQEKTGVSEEELERFQWAADHMYLPYDEELGINPQDDAFLHKKAWREDNKEDKHPLLLHYHPMYLYRYQICKQADTVLAYYILEDMQDMETMKRSFAYYETITTHDSSLSTCIFSIVASRLGLAEKAYQYFGESAKLDLYNTHNNTKDGIHTANMGGTYMAIVYGFGGVRIKEEGLHLSPQLPEKWDHYQFRILYEDSKIDVIVEQEKCVISLVEGNEKEIYIYDQNVKLTDMVEIRR